MSIRRLVERLTDERVEWWTVPDEHLLQALNYPVTSSKKEWVDEIHTLDKLLVEGFRLKALRKRCEALQVSIEADWASLKTLKALLIGLGWKREHADELLDPLVELHLFRSKLAGHASGQSGKELVRKSLGRWGDRRRHFWDLADRCDASFSRIAFALLEE